MHVDKHSKYKFAPRSHIQTSLDYLYKFLLNYLIVEESSHVMYIKFGSVMMKQTTYRIFLHVNVYDFRNACMPKIQF